MTAWFTRLSAAGFWALVAYLLHLDRAMTKTWADMALEDDPEEIPWTWVVDGPDGGGQPLYLPTDLALRAIEILDHETPDAKQDMAGQQWHWLVNAMAIRNAQDIAREEPDPEVALFTWVAQQPNPTALED